MSGENEADPAAPEEREVPDKLKKFSLLRLEDADQDFISKLLLIVQTQPRPHPILPSLINPIDDTNKLIELIRTDPEISAKILQTVNSAAYYHSQKVASLNYAILYLGTNLVRDITLRVAIQSDHLLGNPVQNFAVEKVWTSSYIASSIGFQLAKQLGLDNAGELSTQALLLGLGNLAMIGYQTEYAQLYTIDIPLIDRISIEQQDLGSNSALVGGKLAEEWNLPAPIIAGLNNSLLPQAIDPSQCNLDQPTLQSVVFCYVVSRIADMLVYKNINDISKIDLDNQNTLEFFYLNEYLKQSGLTRLLEVFKDPNFRRQANSFIKKVIPE
jgi:HD-like signal output (HDOD) protein